MYVFIDTQFTFIDNVNEAKELQRNISFCVVQSVKLFLSVLCVMIIPDATFGYRLFVFIDLQKYGQHRSWESTGLPRRDTTDPYRTLRYMYVPSPYLV